MAFAILRYEKLKTLGNVSASLSHNYRTIKTPNADKSKTALNEHTFTSKWGALEAIKNRLPEKRRKDAVPCIEFLITASPDWNGWNTQKENAFFDQSKKWLEEKYGKDNVCSVSIHRDETTPHLVAYIVPLTEKGTLSAKAIVGNRSDMSKTQSSFASHVENLGLERGLESSKAEHTTIKQYYGLINAPVKPAMFIQINKPGDKPKPGLFESKEHYAENVVNSVYVDMENQLVQQQEQLDSAYLQIQTKLKEAERIAKEAKKIAKEWEKESLFYYEKSLKLKDEYKIFSEFEQIFPADFQTLKNKLHEKIMVEKDELALAEHQVRYSVDLLRDAELREEKINKQKELEQERMLKKEQAQQELNRAIKAVQKKQHLPTYEQPSKQPEHVQPVLIKQKDKGYDGPEM